MLNERGAKCEGGMEFPTKEQLDKTDVLILHAQEAGNIKIGEERKNLTEFLARGGGVVTIHAAAVSKDHDWFKTIIGGSWHFGQTKWLEAPMSLYFTDHDNAITKDISNFDIDDEIYYDMDLLPEAKILAAAYTPNTRSSKAATKKPSSAPPRPWRRRRRSIFTTSSRRCGPMRRTSIAPSPASPAITIATSATTASAR